MIQAQHRRSKKSIDILVALLDFKEEKKNFWFFKMQIAIIKLWT